MRAAIAGLGTIASAGAASADAAVGSLLTLLADPARHDAVLSVVPGLPPSAIPLVCRGLEHALPGIRRGTVEALARFRHAEATAGIERALGDETAEIREAAIVALSRLGTLRGFDRLSELAKRDPSKAVRRAAATALVRLRPKRGSGPGPSR